MTDEQFKQLLALLSRYTDFCTGFEPEKHAHVYRLMGEIAHRLSLKEYKMVRDE